jgi:hypothetical protein
MLVHSLFSKGTFIVASCCNLLSIYLLTKLITERLFLSLSVKGNSYGSGSTKVLPCLLYVLAVCYGFKHLRIAGTVSVFWRYLRDLHAVVVPTFVQQCSRFWEHRSVVADVV